jgi:hypothetical protein
MEEIKLENLQDAPLEKLRDVINEGQAKPQAKEEATETPEVKEEVKPEVTEEKKEITPETGKEESPLILGKFKTQDDVLKAYQELEKKTTQEAQLRSKYREVLDPYVDFDATGNISGMKNVPPPVITSPQKEVPQSDILTILENRYNALEAQVGPIRANLIIQAEMAEALVQKGLSPIDEIKADKAVESQKRKLRSRSDFNQLEDEIDNYLSRMDAKSKQNPAAVETVYNLIKGTKVDQLLKDQANEIQLKVAEIEKQKQAAQVEHPTKTPEEPQPDLTDTQLNSKELAKRAGLERIERY